MVGFCHALVMRTSLASLALSVLGLSIAACAGPRADASSPGTCACSAASGPSEELVVWANGSARSLRMVGDRAWGPTAELKRFDGAYRGSMAGSIVDLHFTDDRVHGTVGSGRFDIYVTSVGGKVHGQGLLNGHISTFDVDDDVVEGSFGSCAYQMKRKTPEGDDYFGYQSCSGGLYPMSRVTIPPAIRALPALDQATLYALLFLG